MSRKPKEMLSCIHSRGPTGKMVNVGCFRAEQYACALFGVCVLKTCPHSRDIKSCQTCMEFAPEGGPKANEFLSKLSEEAKKDYGIEPVVKESELEDILNDTQRISEDNSGESEGDSGISQIDQFGDIE